MVCWFISVLEMLSLTEDKARVRIIVVLPPSSSGLGHSPLKAKTGVRVPVGAQLEPVDDIDRFLSLIGFEQRIEVERILKMKKN